LARADSPKWQNALCISPFCGVSPGLAPKSPAAAWQLPDRYFGPGHVVIGGFDATNRFESIYQMQLQRSGVDEAFTPLAEESGDYGLYLLWEQQFYQDTPNSPGGLYFFTRAIRSRC
jgi:hypothetical protein